MARVINLKDGRQVFTTRYGVPIQNIANLLFRAMADIADQVPDGNYLEIEDKNIGYIELHFYEKEN